MSTRYSGFIFFILCLLLLISCFHTNVDDKVVEKSLPVIQVKNRADSLLKKCIPHNDTGLNSNTSIKYIIIDSFFTVKLEINGIDTVLAYRFNCTAPRGLVPVIHSYYRGTLCMLRGGGQHFREFIIAYYDQEKIFIKEYETALATDLVNNFVVYRNYMRQEEIIVENIRTSHKKKLMLPVSYAHQPILDATIKNRKLKLGFSGNKLVFNL
jgi:hypothetical protein